jgi:hypothetical protein
VDPAGNLWIADTKNNVIREVTGNVSAGTGTISTVAGNYPLGLGYSGNNGPATSAQLNGPLAVAFDPNFVANVSGNLYIADTGNNVVREVSATTGEIAAFAGNGTGGLPGTGSATTQSLYAPSGLAVDPAGNVYITLSDTKSNSEICKVRNGNIAIVTTNVTAPAASTIPSQYSEDNLYDPIGITLDSMGDIYFADTLDMEIKEIPSNLVLMDFTVYGPIRQGQSSPTVSQSIENDGNSPLDLAPFTVANSTMVPNATAPITYPIPPINVAQSGTTTSTCTTLTGGLLPENDDCTIAAIFAPGTSPLLDGALTTLISDINIADDSAGSIAGGNSPLMIETYGVASELNSTTTTLPSGPLTQVFGSGTLMATVTSGYIPPAIALTGYITFTDTFTDPTTGSTTVTPLPSATGVKVGSTTVNSSTNSEFATASISLAALHVGVHSIVACYNVSGADTAHTGSCSSPDNGGTPLQLTIFENTSTAVSSSANPSLLGADVTFTATVSTAGGFNPDSTVNFTDTVGSNAPTTLCADVSLVFTTGTTGTAACTLHGGAGLSQGLNLITAYYQADASGLVGTSFNSTPFQQKVQIAPNVTFSSTPSTSNYGSPVTFTFTVAGTPAATGTVAFSNGSTTLGTATSATGTWTFSTTAAAPLPVGNLTITATYSGDSNYAKTTATVSQVVTQTTTTTVLSAPATGISGLPTSLSATVTVTAGSGTPGGTVTFMDGTTKLGTGTLSGGKTTLVPSPILPLGVNSLTAVYSNDANDGGSTSAPVPVSISLGTTALAFVNPPATAVVELPVNFTVQVTSNGVTPTGNVVFLDGSTPIGTVALAGGSATLTYTFTSTSATAPHAISATYAGDANNAPPAAALPADVMNVTAIPTQTSLAQATTTGPDSSLILIATVVGVDLPTQFPPTGTVVFTNGSATLGSAQLSNGVATFQPAATGQLNVVATYTPTLSPADPLHLGSASAALAVTNNGNGFTLTATPPTLTISPSQNASVTLTITPVNGVKDTVGLGCGSLPPGMTCTFSPLTVAMDGVHPQTVTLVIDTNNPLLGGATAMNAPRTGTRLTLASIFCPFGLLSGLLLWRLRKRSALLKNASLLLLFAASAILMNGCGGIGKSAAVPGTYTIQVVGVGINSNITQYVSLTVTVTK